MMEEFCAPTHTMMFLAVVYPSSYISIVDVMRLYKSAPKLVASHSQMSCRSVLRDRDDQSVVNGLIQLCSGGFQFSLTISGENCKDSIIKWRGIFQCDFQAFDTSVSSQMVD